MRDGDVPAALHLPQVGGDIYDELVRRLGYQPQVADPVAAHDAQAEPIPDASPFEPSPFEPSPFEPSPFEPSLSSGLPPGSALAPTGAEDVDDEPSPFGGDLGADLFEGAPADDVWDADPGPGRVVDHPAAPVPRDSPAGPTTSDPSTDPFYATLPAMPPLASTVGRA